MAEVDVFDLWRYLLSTVVTIYTLVYTGRTVWNWVAYFGTSHRHAVMGRYASVLLLRTRMRKFSGELVRLGLLLVLLAVVVGLHWVLV
jgi:hypothetical protein